MAVLKGTSKADTIIGTKNPDFIYGYGGNDKLYGRAGNDQIWGGTQDDQIWGEAGNDKLYGEAGNDFLRGEAGNDSVYGGIGNDIVYGGTGDDSLFGDAGTDTVKGDAGNDIIKGGTGISYLYGGDGNDSLYYDPTKENIGKVKGYLADSLLDGDAGTDTLNIYNHATYTSGKKTPSAATQVNMDGRNSGDIYFYNPDPDKYESIDVGHFQEVEKITVTGAGKLEFSGSGSAGKSIDITGTANNDVFRSYGASDTMRGAGGNDDFYISGGKDTVISGANDADRFFFDATSPADAKITGFNGAGKYGGDRLYFDNGYGSSITSTITEVDGKTEFEIESSGDYSYGLTTVVVDAVGLEEGVDYFFV
jgi:Ca2+-binding RTX toxin-like protein